MKGWTRIRGTKPILILLLALMLTACGAESGSGDRNGGAASSFTEQDPPQMAEEAEPPATKTLTDVMGHKVIIPGQPRRVLAPYLEDPLAALGIEPVAQTSYTGTEPEYGYLQPWLKNVPIFNLSGEGLTYEKVLGEDPDLLILFNPGFAAGGKYEGYSKIAPTYVMDSSSDWRGTLLTMGDIFGKSAEARQAIDDYERKAAEAKAKLAQTIGSSKVAIISLTGKSSFSVWIEKFWSGSVLYHDLGLQPPALAEGKDVMGEYSLEALADLQDADFIFLVNVNGMVETSGILKNPVWQSLPAVKDGHFIEMKEKYWSINGLIASRSIVDDVMKSLAG